MALCILSFCMHHTPRISDLSDITQLKLAMNWKPTCQCKKKNANGGEKSVCTL